MAIDMDFDDFVAGYIECLLWCGVMEYTEDDMASCDDLDEDEIPEAALAEIKKDCSDFFEANEADLLLCTLDAGQCGHDFYLTRNGHGAGFWDRKRISPEADAALDRLTDACRPYGTQGLMVYARENDSRGVELHS